MQHWKNRLLDLFKQALKHIKIVIILADITIIEAKILNIISAQKGSLEERVGAIKSVIDGKK